MYIRCYKSRSDIAIREQLWDLIGNKSTGWVSDHVTYMLFYIPERLLPFALLIDSDMEHLRELDYID